MLRTILIAVVAIVLLVIVLVIWGVVEIGEEAADIATEPDGVVEEPVGD